MPTYLITWDSGQADVNVAAFNQQREARWGTTAIYSPLNTGDSYDVWDFSLPYHPLTPVRDDAAPRTVGWLPVLKLEADSRAPGGYRWLPKLADGTITCSLFSTGALSLRGGIELARCEPPGPCRVRHLVAAMVSGGCEVCGFKRGHDDQYCHHFGHDNGGCGAADDAPAPPLSDSLRFWRTAT